ncbi:MAG: sulfatase [Microgenomates group bacterium]
MKYRGQNRIFLLLFIIVPCILIVTLVVTRIRVNHHKTPICKDCNVVLISLDTLSANHLPCYGYERDTAPFLCSFAKKNIMFKNMFSNSNTTLPSHVSMLTGLYPSSHKVNLANVDSLSPTMPFLPKILQDNGYLTHFYFTLSDPSNLPVDKVFYRGINTITSVDHPRDWKRGLDLLDANNTKGEKTFLFLHSYWVHSPYILENKDNLVFGKSMDKGRIPSTWNTLTSCTPEYLSYLEDAIKEDIDNVYWGGENDSLYIDLYKDLSEINRDDPVEASKLCAEDRYALAFSLYFRSYYSYLLRSMDMKDALFMTNLYDSKIKELDGYIQETVSHILNSKLKKNTVIIITSDHGEEFMEHGLWEHGKNLYDTSVKVPLILFIPGYTTAETDILAQSVDIVPTILKIIGIPNPSMTDGKDLFSKQPRELYVIAEKTIDSIKTIRDSQWKLHISTKTGDNIPYELYDIIRDPNEMNNVIFLHPNIVKKLIDALSKIESR